MSDDIDALLTQRAGGDDIDSLLTARAKSDTPDNYAIPTHTPTNDEVQQLKQWNKRTTSSNGYTTGLADPFVGAGQLMQHLVPDAALNAARRVTDPIVNAILPGKSVDSTRTSASDFDQMVQRREQYHKADRAEAGKTGFDWERLTGNLANPVTWMAPESRGAGIMAGIANGAKQGLFQSLLQPVTEKGNFLFNKGIQSAVGTAVGGTLGGALEALKPAFSWSAGLVRKALGSDEAAQKAAAQATDEVLKTAGADPQKVDPTLYSSIRQEVQDALKAGVDPDPKVMLNRADAGSLPVPVQLTRGQATRDPMQFSWEQEMAKKAGLGEDLTARITQQNHQLIENLNQLGAHKAPAPIDASKALIGHIENIDSGLKSKISAAYDAVRDSAGRPALMDHVTFVKQANDALDKGQLGPFVPEPIRRQLNDIAEGKLPLTVNVAQQLDKVWSAAQRGTTDGSVKMAIGQLRDAINQAPVSDALGQESMQAYKAARELARQRFGMIESNPAYKAVVDGIEPDKFFQKYVQGANVADLGKLKQLVGPENSQMLQQTFVGNLKRIAINKASDENGVFSQSAYNRVLQDPVQGPRIQELFKESPDVLEQLYRLGRVAENVVKEPKGNYINHSNTTSAAVNFLRDAAKDHASSSFFGMFPGGRAVQYLTQQAGEKSAAQKAVKDALNPGVTTSAIKSAPSTQVRRLSDLLARGAAAGAMSETQE